MLIINADDWGRSRPETDAPLTCFRNGRITSASAMMFMADSERAAELAAAQQLDVGLHLNFDEAFTGRTVPPAARDVHGATARFLRRHRFAQLIYNPFLAKAFATSCAAQFEEFARLFGRTPSHVDGHHHMHLCGNMLLGRAIPAGMPIRRHFSFWRGEKSALNRGYRAASNSFLKRRYRMPDYLFDLGQCLTNGTLARVASLAKSANVELMTHPNVESEVDFLMSDRFDSILGSADLGTFARLSHLQVGNVSAPGAAAN